MSDTTDKDNNKHSNLYNSNHELCNDSRLKLQEFLLLWQHIVAKVDHFKKIKIMLAWEFIFTTYQINKIYSQSCHTEEDKPPLPSSTGRQRKENICNEFL